MCLVNTERQSTVRQQMERIYNNNRRQKTTEAEMNAEIITSTYLATNIESTGYSS